MTLYRRWTSTASAIGARGPGFFKLDMRLGYQLQFGGRRTLELFGEIFNVTDRANFANSERQPATIRPTS